MEKYKLQDQDWRKQMMKPKKKYWLGKENRRAIKPGLVPAR